MTLNPEKTSESINEMTQLVYYDFTINENIDTHIEKTGFNSVGKNYNTIAIIGAQSTGKSTLLNKLFDTNFAVMTSNVGRGQTTKGVWAATHVGTKIFILDCEGTDSKERGEDRHKFEHSSSLFCLAMADVLIINMWTNDVGRYTASNYGVLKIVFEMNLKLFQQECSKKILIVLRDFDSSRNVKSKIEEMILKDIKSIWNDIKKPEKYRDSEPSNFFEFEFITLPHKKYFEEKFDEEVKLLRNRLEAGNPQYLFNHVSSSKNVPADGIKQYIFQLWNDIINEKELNIPSQKEMLSNYRCNEIKDSVLMENDQAIRDIQNLSAKEIIDDFESKCNEIADKIFKGYDKTASNYLDKIYLNVRRQLEANLSQKFYMCFANQAKRMIPLSQKQLRQELERDIKNKGDDFVKISDAIKNKYLKLLLSKLSKKKVFNSWNITEEEYRNVFDEIIDCQRKVCLDEKKQQTIKTMKKQIEESLINKIETFSSNFWVDFNRDYLSFFAIKIFPLKTYLKEFYNMSLEEILEFCKYVEADVYNNTKTAITKKSREISSLSVELFKKKFWYEKEEQRNWNKLEEEDIDNLFKKHRGELVDLFDVFRTFKVLKCPLKYLRFETIENNDFGAILKETSDNLPLILERETETFEGLLRQNEISSMKRKFEEGITSLLEDAKRRKSGLFQHNLPWWAWALIIFFGFDDFLRWVKSIWIVPIILLISSYFVLQKLNMLHIVRDNYYDLEEKIWKLKKKIFK